MPLKKRMFGWNMTILIAALFSLMGIILGVAVLFEDSLERQIHGLSLARLEPHVTEAAQLMENGLSGQETVWLKEDGLRLLEEWGYQTAVIRKEQVISGSGDEAMAHLAEVLEELRAGTADGEPVGNQGDGGRGTEILVYHGATIVRTAPGEDGAFFAAVYFPEEGDTDSSLRASFSSFLGAVLLIGTGAIAVLVILAAFFTRRMNRVVMEPIELLTAGAGRVKEGVLDEDISYQGEAEFEQVCRAFNEMQRTILEDQKQRARTEQARTDMVTGISHDLRTPLTSIRGYIKGILDGVADTDARRRTYLQTAYEATEEMDVLLQKLFDFSRMESGQMPFHLVKVDLGEYVAAYVAQKEAAADPDRLKFRLTISGEYLPEVPVDVEQVRRILDNLLENSLKYAGTVPVQVDLEVNEEEKGILLVWKDNGQGVPEEKLGRIFERFYRCDESRKEKGSGVGLYVVKYIMERLGGWVKAENENGLKLTLFFPKEA